VVGLGISAVDQHLQVPGHVNLAVTAVHPAVNCEVVDQMLHAALLDGVLDQRMVKGGLEGLVGLPGINGRMDALLEHLGLDNLGGRNIDPALVHQLVLQNIVDDMCDSRGGNGVLASPLGCKERSHQRLGRLLGANGLEVKRLARMVGLDHSHNALHLLNGELIERVGSHGGNGDVERSWDAMMQK
jgi:hypothetical protein